eukprot:CAMPEP_0172548632 /NCGR_PEP_ID=MMETSP1067-20121228/17872_1 /TAXON_ID=265564 ORGANISM="Thalassiosira punctigera, Strain Tpunct2005C2" /NCGR_SAMPLE_ID=MMETSP1067 /ASSEMBLY_ACC=CAM_ASM_000444 /LENGTH=816 /DNA_ID=CAMNT_0013335873 /DNA_START=47 /DNA_END=2497 /DNA_ORIENTATION=+
MMESTPLVSSKLAPQLLLERQRALKGPGVGKAAHLIKDAVMGHQDAPYEGYYDPYQNERSVLLNKISLICGRLVVRLKGAVKFCSWVLFMLTFFEPPPWCRDASHLFVDGYGHDLFNSESSTVKEYGDCKLLLDMHGTLEDGEETQQLYPSYNSMWLTIYQSKLTELACVCFISLYMVFEFADDGFDLRLFFYRGSHKCWIHAVRCFGLICLLASAIVDNTTINPFLRMLILGTFLRAVQKEMWTFMKMIPEIMLPISLLAVTVTFYAWFGVVIFYDTREGRTAFPSLAEGMWTLYTCVTTANYPDVMMPVYNEYRIVALYFISFMVISFFYLMNLVLAIAVNTYDESIEQRKHYREQLSKRLLTEAYALLDHNSEDSVSRESIMNVMTILNQDVAEIQGLAADEMAIMYAILDKDGSNCISLDEFLGFGSVLLIKLSKSSDYATFVETHLPSIFGSSFYQTLCKSVKSKTFESVMEVILVLNAVIIAAQDYPVLVGQNVIHDVRNQVVVGNSNGHIDAVWEGAETVFTVVYVFEAMLKIMVYGWKRYIESPRNVFDFFITVLVVLASVYVYYPNTYSNIRLIEFVVMARVLRLSRLIFAIDSFRVFGVISLDIIPAASSVFLVLLFIAYSFATVGMLLFGGVISHDTNNLHHESLMEADDFVDNEYWGNNFNDMFSGMNVLFNMLVVNNWPNQASGLECATGNKLLVRLFFASFYLLGVTGIGNVITSFIINAFFQQMNTIEHRQGPDEKVEGEAVISGAQAVFDTTSITGTSTGLQHITYVARISSRHRDVEVDERAALRQLFSGPSSSGNENN